MLVPCLGLAQAQETPPEGSAPQTAVLVLPQLPPLAPGPGGPTAPVTEPQAAQVPQPVTDIPTQSALARALGPTTVFATADTYYEYNGNHPASGNNVLRNFDEKDNQFSLSYLELAFEQTPTATRRLGFRADLGFGPTATWVASSDPDEGSLKYLQQGYVSYLAPLGRGVQIDAGKFVTPAGAELIESSANWNYSRSLLFAWAAPYYHMGLRVGVPVHDKVTVSGFLVNGWNNAFENNRGKTIGAQVAYTPTESVTISQAWLGGPEQPNGIPAWRHLFDTVATWQLHPRLSIMGNLDIGRDEIDGQRVAWHGIAGYAHVKLLPSWHLTPRVEWFEDAQGFATGTAQTLREFTVTSEHTLVGGLSVRLEYRRDWSNQEFFAYGSDEFRRQQHTVLFGFIYAMQSQ